eukprot:scaffold20.g7765.t1
MQGAWAAAGRAAGGGATPRRLLTAAEAAPQLDASHLLLGEIYGSRDQVLTAGALTDLTAPASWFPAARALSRRIIAHLGPTNSGKTWSALQALRAAGSGVYAGPLRLLAAEVAVKLNAPEAGVPCHLITGQERKEVPGARHTACTVEMVSTSRPVEVGVIDEIQLAADASRGWSFTRTLLGLPARELHVCGAPEVEGLLRRLCEEAGDPLEVRRYERLSTLRPARQALGSLERLQSGDCVVAFSRRGVHALRAEIETLGRHSAAVVYGALPPSPRLLQAQAFNTPRSGVSVLAASDAVGMGLNLRIKRVIFATMRKFDGVAERPLHPHEIRQIAGRAGRHTQAGVATTLHAADLPALHAGLASPPEEAGVASILPPYHMIEAFALQHSGVEEVHRLAVMIQHLPLSLREAYLFAIAPCDPVDDPVAAAFLRFAAAFAARRAVPAALVLACPSQPARSEAELQVLEALYRQMDLFVWLAFRFPDAFQGREVVERQRDALAALIDASLREIGLPPALRRQRRREEAALAAALGSRCA